MIYGFTGVGKTALALDIANRFLNEPGTLNSVLLRDLRTTSLPALCDAIIAACHGAIIDTANTRQKVAAAAGLLATYQPLLILDNLADYDTAAAFIECVRPSGLPTIITTQHRDLADLADTALDLEVLDPSQPGIGDAALRLFRSRARLPEREEDAAPIEEIARLLGYHPFSLAAVAAQHAATKRPLADLAVQLQNPAYRLGRGPGGERERSIRAALQVAYDALPNEAQHVLSLLAACPARTTGLPFLSLVCERDEIVLADSLDVLITRSLADRLDDRATLHQLTRDFTRSLPVPSSSETDTAFFVAARAYARQYSDKTPGDQARITEEADNLVLAAERAVEGTAWDTSLDLADTILSKSAALQRRGLWTHAVRLGRAGIAAARATNSDAALARLLHNTGIVLQAQGEPDEARRLYTESLAIKQRLDDQGGVAASLGQLGNIAYQQGALDEARRLYGEARATFERLGDQGGVATSLHQLGMLAYRQGEPNEARQLYTESLAIARRRDDQDGVATSLHQLGILAQAQGEPNEARRLYTESLAIKQRLGDQGGAASSLHQLGILAQAQGEPDEARRLYTESLAIARRLGDQSRVATSLGQLGILAYQQGEPDEARRLYGEARATFERLSDQGGVATSLHQLGLLAQAQGELDEARRLYREAQAIFVRLGDQSRVVTSLHQLGILAEGVNELDEARRLYGESLDIARRLGDQRGAASSLHNLGALAEDAGDADEARRLFIEALVIFERLGSPNAAIARRSLDRVSPPTNDAP